MTGLFFGSFNPIHNGHLAVAKYILDCRLCDEVWFVISPRNPFKTETALLDERKRKEIVEEAIVSDARMKACDIEFGMPKPSYTIDTLRVLSERYDKPFSLIIGEDNLQEFHLWKDYKKIYAQYKIWVYPRSGMTPTTVSYPNVERINAPLLDVSSTQIRLRLKNGEPIDAFVPENVRDTIIRYYE